MAKRACMTVDEVVLQCDDSDEDLDDDLDEPIMDGSDGEFSDLEGNELDDETEADDLDSSPDLTLNAGSPGLYVDDDNKEHSIHFTNRSGRRYLHITHRSLRLVLLT